MPFRGPADGKKARLTPPSEPEQLLGLSKRATPASMWLRSSSPSREVWVFPRMLMQPHEAT
jgi:hypothetical protein